MDKIREHSIDNDISEFIGMSLLHKGYEMYKEKHGSIKHLICTDMPAYHTQMERRIETAYRFARFYLHRYDGVDDTLIDKKVK